MLILINVHSRLWMFSNQMLLLSCSGFSEASKAVYRVIYFNRQVSLSCYCLIVFMLENYFTLVINPTTRFFMLPY